MSYRTHAVQVQCHGSGAPQEVLTLEPATLPPQLEWGQVLVAWRCARVCRGMRTSRLYGPAAERLDCMLDAVLHCEAGAVCLPT